LAERWPRWRIYFDESRIKDYIGESFGQDKFDADMNDDQQFNEECKDDELYPNNFTAEADENDSAPEICPNRFSNAIRGPRPRIASA
jgi:hypothetical protein